MSDTAGLDADRRLLRAAVAAAGALALAHFRHEPRRWQKAPGQIVTEADLAIDRLLHERLIGARPDDAWLSEESADDRVRLERARVWMVDPIDGTRAFARGLPEFTISVALVVEGRPVLGIVLNPATGERFEATRGSGAWLGDEPLRASDRREVAGTRLVASRTELSRRRWSELIQGPAFTPLSSLAYKLALVAAGRFDGLVSLRSSHDWDLAAALLMIEEAGGLITQADGTPIRLNQPTPRHAGLIATGTAELHRELRGRLSTLAPR